MAFHSPHSPYLSLIGPALSLFAALGAPAPLFGQTDTPVTKPADPQPATETANPLAGPRVKDKAEARSLVSRDSAGKLVVLDQRPEAAAVPLLDLDPEGRAAADKVLTERYELVSRTLHENIALFLKIQAARQGGGDASELAPLMREFRPVAEPLVRPPLIDRLAAVLPEEKGKEVRRLVSEYVEALASEPAPDGRHRPAPPRPQDPMSQDHPRIIPPQMEYRLVLREMGRVLAATVAERRERFEAFMKAIDATPEQESKIQALIRGNTPPSVLGPTQAQRAELFNKIMPLLTPEQRERADKFLRGG